PRRDQSFFHEPLPSPGGWAILSLLGGEVSVFRVTPVQVDPKTWVLAVQGAIDLSNLPAFQESFEEVFEKGFYRIIIDLERVTFISSAGFRCLLDSRETILAKGGTMVFDVTTRHVRDNFDR